MTTPSSKIRRGFTLIELLTVIAIIGILAAILIPTVSRVRESAKRAKCMSNVRQITLSLIAQANQNKGQKFPQNTGAYWAWDTSHEVIKDVVGLAGREVLYCPSSPMVEIEGINRMFEFSPNGAVTIDVLLLMGTPSVECEGPSAMVLVQTICAWSCRPCALNASSPTKSDFMRRVSIS